MSDSILPTTMNEAGSEPQAFAPASGSFSGMLAQVNQARAAQTALRSAPPPGVDLSRIKPDAQGRVEVLNPDGDHGTLPLEELSDALNEGYTLETPDQKAVRQFKNEYSGLGGAALVAAGQAVNQIGFGVPEVLVDHLANPLTVKKIESLKDEHQLANITGGVGGFIGSLLYGGPLFKAAGATGEAALNLSTHGLSKLGIDRASKSFTKEMAARILTNAARYGTEGAVIAAPRAITEGLLGDPKAAAESLAMGGAFGSLLGAVGGPTGKIFDVLQSKFGEKAGLALEDMANARPIPPPPPAKVQATMDRIGAYVDESAKAGGAAPPEGALPEQAPSSSYVSPTGERTSPNPNAESDGTLLGGLRVVGADDDLINRVEAGQSNLKSNAKEIQEANKLLGVETLPEQVSREKTVQDAGAALAKRTDTVAGSQRAKIYSDHYDAYDAHLKAVLNQGATSQSVFQTGQKLQAELVAKAKAAIDAGSELFEALGEDYSTIGVSQKGLNQIATNIQKLPVARTSVGAAKSLAKKIATALRSGDLRTLSDLKEFRTGLLKDLSKTASDNENFLMREVSERLLNHEDSSIDRHALDLLAKRRNAGLATVQELDRLSQLFDQMQSARRQWRELIENFNQDMDAFGKRDIRSPRDFIDAVSDKMSAEDLVKAFTPKNDVKALRHLATKYPEQFEAVRLLNKHQLLEKATKDGRLNIGSVITKYRDMTPEYREAMFTPHERSIMDAVRTAYEAIPKDINPSGTAKTLGWFGSLGAKGYNPGAMGKQIIENVQAANKAHELRKAVSVEGVLAAEKSLNAARSKLDMIPEMLTKLSKGVKGAADQFSVPRTTNALLAVVHPDDHGNDNQKALDTIQTKVSEYQANPSHLIDTIANSTKGLSQTGAPNIAEAYGQHMTNTMDYVAQIMPKPVTPPNPFYDRPYTPSNSEMASFNRKLEVIHDPSSVIRHLGQGTLTKDQIEAADVNYPLFMQAVRLRTLDHVVKHKLKFSYPKRLKLSLLMGMDIDGTTKGSNVLAYQNAFMQTPSAQNSDGLNSAGLQKLSLAKQSATESQRRLAQT